MMLTPDRMPMAMDPARSWYLLVLQANMSQDRRQQLANYLADIGGAFYAPTEGIAVTRGRGNKRHRVVERRPLLGNYGLVQLPRVNTPFTKLLSAQARAFGVFEVIRGSGGAPAQVPSRVVAHLIDRDSRGEFEHYTIEKGRIVKLLPFWLFVGATVVARESNFWLGGMLLVVKEIDRRRNRLVLMMEGYNIPIHLGIEDVRGL